MKSQHLTLVALCVFIFFFVLWYSPIIVTIQNKDTYNKPTQWLIDVYQKQATSRREFLDKIISGPKESGFARLYNNLAPEVYCAEKVKVGTTDDGGKWMCSPQNLPLNCVVFALGINDVITFEYDLQNYSNKRCRVVSVDSKQQSGSVIEALNKIRGVVVKAMISASDSNKTRTMDSILKENQVKEVEILKMDIEGAEYSVLEKFLDKYTVSQVMFETHNNAIKTLNLLRMIASKGYLLFHYEINGANLGLCEYAFIHSSRLEQYGGTFLAKYL